MIHDYQLFTYALAVQFCLHVHFILESRSASTNGMGSLGIIIKNASTKYDRLFG